MVLSLAACGGKADDNKGKTEVTMTAQEIMDTLKEKLGDSFGCDVAETEDNISGYWGLDMGQVESWASMSNSNSAVNSSYAVIVKVKEGYAQDAAALLQTGYEQILSYSRMYNMDLQKVLQARLFVNGNYAALLGGKIFLRELFDKALSILAHADGADYFRTCRGYFAVY